MGPRARARGNPPCYLRATDHSSLQWGHERALVEIDPGVAVTPTTLGLQWGHERALVEILLHQLELTARHKLQWGHERALVEISTPTAIPANSKSASMGPRARARGNTVLSDGFVTLHFASMGPRARARGNQKPVLASTLQSCASMGPRARARGNTTKMLLKHASG